MAIETEPLSKAALIKMAVESVRR